MVQSGRNPIVNTPPDQRGHRSVPTPPGPCTRRASSRPSLYGAYASHESVHEAAAHVWPRLIRREYSVLSTRTPESAWRPSPVGLHASCSSGLVIGAPFLRAPAHAQQDCVLHTREVGRLPPTVADTIAVRQFRDVGHEL